MLWHACRGVRYAETSPVMYLAVHDAAVSHVLLWVQLIVEGKA